MEALALPYACKPVYPQD